MLGFGKGIGKGLLGAVTRPTAGVVDFASSTLDAAKRVGPTLSPPLLQGSERGCGEGRGRGDGCAATAAASSHCRRPHHPPLQPRPGRGQPHAQGRPHLLLGEGRGWEEVQGAEKGAYAESDNYVAHADLEKGFFLFLTDQ